MKTMQITTCDGRLAKVEESRFLAFDSLRSDPLFRANLGAQLLTGDMDGALAFIVSQLTFTESTVFEVLALAMQWREALAGCITSEAGDWVDSVRYEIVQGTGRGKRISGRSADLPRVDVAFSDFSVPVYQGGISYDYTTEELRRTAQLRRPLPELRLRQAIEGYERHMNEIGLFGEGDLTGLFNNPNVPQGNSAVSGGWVSAYTASPSTAPAAIIADFNNGIWTIYNSTNFNDLPTDVAIPPVLYNFLVTTYATEAGFFNKTLMQLIKENNLVKEITGRDLNIYPGYGLNTAGVSANNRIVYYVKDKTRIVCHMPMPLRFLAPQLRGLDVIIPGEYKYSGVNVRYPKSAFYQDGE